ncbi:hypothetical protein QTL95_13835 [Rhizobium sp. S152]|uniref:hypothetical protein n=1 Tax=Rhizobium sp. S152 TaxID=3055038 RepID=UPI0025A9EE81|nr:hypothetical protein [Rhizobium sp. S152]MDM9626983.1 hypothetical protein [Rhizobium sp. S152]
MNRFRKIALVGMLIALSAVATACQSVPRSAGNASGYVPGDSLNRACSDGFRPNDGRSCSY